MTGDATLGTAAPLTLGSLVALSNGATLTLDADNALVLTGDLSGTGNLIKTGADDVTLVGGKTFTGNVAVQAGSLTTQGNGVLANVGTLDLAAGGQLNLNGDASLGALSGSGQANLGSGATLSLGSNDLDTAFAGALNGLGSLAKVGNGRLILSGVSALGGNTQVNGGTLQVDGTLSSAGLNVASGASLSGSGTVAAPVGIGASGRLIGNSGSTLGLGSLVLDNAANVDVGLATPSTNRAALFAVGGDLTLGGTLNISDIGGFGNGVYRLFDYGGVLTDNGLAFGNLPLGVALGNLALQTALVNQVNLLVSGSGLNILFWNGSQTQASGQIAGVWNASTTNWTDFDGTVNSTWGDTFAVFQGTPGDVSVEGNQRVTGLQFAADGYRVIDGSAGQLELIDGERGDTPVRVDRGVTATLDLPLVGSGRLTKLDSGTLVLGGSNRYSGGTQLGGGTLVLGSDSALGSGALDTVAGATLDANQAVNIGNAINLTGPLTVAGSRALSGDNRYAGGTSLQGGTLVVGADTALGSGVLSAADGTSLDSSQAVTLANAVNLAGDLTVLGGNDLALGGPVSGAGRLFKAGFARFSLLGANRFSGGTELRSGTLVVGNDAASAPAHWTSPVRPAWTAAKRSDWPIRSMSAVRSTSKAATICNWPACSAATVC